MVIPRRHAILALALLLALTALTVWLLRPTPERQIRRQLRLLSQTVAKKGPESAIRMATRGERLRELVAPTCRLRIAGTTAAGTYRCREIANYATRFRSQFDTLKLELYDIEIALHDAVSATVEFRARLAGRSQHGGQVDEIRRVVTEMEKADSGWVFNDFEVSHVIQR